MNSLRPRDTRQRVSLLLFACALFVFAVPETMAAQTNPLATPKSNRSSGSGLAADVYVGTNVSGYGSGYVTSYIINSAGVSASAAGSSVSGASGSLNVTAQFVFATDGRYIVTYTRDAGGGLAQTSSVDGTAHNITPPGSEVGALTLDRTGHTLYAAEIEYDGSDNDAYSIWTINADGSLSFVNNVGPSVYYNSPLAFTQDNHYAYSYGCYFAGWDVPGFARNSDGTLAQFESGALPPPSNDFICPSDVETSAMNYVVIAFIDVEAPGSLEQLGSFTLNSDGTLTLLPSTVITTPFDGERNMAFDPTGQYLAVSGGAGIQMYSLQAGGTLAPIGSVVDSGVPFNVVKWDNSNHLYAISGAALYVFSSNAGVLTQAPGSPMPVTEAGSLAVLPEE
jgi:6-phosphogluconolactonase (cycloisomerase 2 family)